MQTTPPQQPPKATAMTDICTACEATGIDDDGDLCPHCKGRGYLTDDQPDTDYD